MRTQFWSALLILYRSHAFPFISHHCKHVNTGSNRVKQGQTGSNYGHQNTLRCRILRKDGLYRPNRTVPSDRTCTSLMSTQGLKRVLKVQCRCTEHQGAIARDLGLSWVASNQVSGQGSSKLCNLVDSASKVDRPQKWMQPQKQA